MKERRSSGRSDDRPILDDDLDERSHPTLRESNLFFLPKEAHAKVTTSFEGAKKRIEDDGYGGGSNKADKGVKT